MFVPRNGLPELTNIFNFIYTNDTLKLSTNSLHFFSVLLLLTSLQFRDIPLIFAVFSQYKENVANYQKQINVIYTYLL